MNTLFEIVSDRIKSPFLRYGLYRNRKRRLRNIKANWKSQQVSNRIESWLASFGTNEENIYYFLHKKIPQRMKRIRL